MKRRIGLFGGTFDPVHTGHLIVAERCREEAGLSEIWFLPAGHPPHKPRSDLLPFEDRSQMVRLAIAGNAGFRLEGIEGERVGLSYTYDTLDELHRRNPGTDFDFILGADGTVDLPTWYRPADILRLCGLCIVRRPGFPDPDMAGLANRLGIAREAIRYRIVESPLVDISSREIRARRRAGRSVRYLVPEKVMAWMDEKEMYSPPERGGE